MCDSCSVAKKMLETLGLDYEIIHAFLNDHILFKKELANEEKCSTCDASHYCKDVQGDKIPNKVCDIFH